MTLWPRKASHIDSVNTLRPRQNGHHFADNNFKCIFSNENLWISIKISLNFVLKGQINNIPTLVQIMAWRWPGAKPLSEPMMVSLLTHICVTRPQWVKSFLLIGCQMSFVAALHLIIGYMKQTRSRRNGIWPSGLFLMLVRGIQLTHWSLGLISFKHITPAG